KRKRAGVSAKLRPNGFPTGIPSVHAASWFQASFARFVCKESPSSPSQPVVFYKGNPDGSKCRVKPEGSKDPFRCRFAPKLHLSDGVRLDGSSGTRADGSSVKIGVSRRGHALVAAAKS